MTIPMVTAKIKAVKKSKNDFDSNTEESPLRPSVSTPKIPKPLAQNRTTAITNASMSSPDFPTGTFLNILPNIQAIRFSKSAKSPKKYPSSTAKITGGADSTFIRFKTPMEKEHSPSTPIILSVVFMGIYLPSQPPRIPPVSTARQFTVTPTGIFFPSFYICFLTILYSSFI